ncbi:unnamed protein product [Schistosoma rodhaini]|uniref:Uncharacterized protein n=1 Tax=Schistosoma rodhaini TaxID=6188 RepID=A0AA85GAW1_9TREM|nr:unnamed protein product [Schistosoma rodhaini]
MLQYYSDHGNIIRSYKAVWFAFLACCTSNCNLNKFKTVRRQCGLYGSTGDNSFRVLYINIYFTGQTILYNKCK